MRPEEAAELLTQLGFGVSGGTVINGGRRYGRVGYEDFFPEGEAAKSGLPGARDKARREERKSRREKRRISEIDTTHFG